MLLAVLPQAMAMTSTKGPLTVPTLVQAPVRLIAALAARFLVELVLLLLQVAVHMLALVLRLRRLVMVD